jgi:hypothetical protein
MNTYEREYFVSRLRSGIYFIKMSGVKIRVLTPTIEDEYEANEVFREAYDKALMENIFTEEEMWDWMISRGLWSDEKEEKIKGIQKDIEKLKVGIYENRYQPERAEVTRQYLRHAEKVLVETRSEKHDLFGKTCEGLATQEKSLAIFERCCFVGTEPLDCSEIDISALFYDYNRMLLTETQLRELARNDPWRLSWLMKDHTPLFANKDGRDLSLDQKGILIWSNMYDNIQESMECPSEDVISDDDMLDGWFIVQRKKQQSDRAKSEIENKTNSKIANSAEILVMAKSNQEAENIHSMNSVHSNEIRKQRIDTVKKKGGAVDLDFQDKKIEVMNQHHQNFKDSIRRK